MLESSHEMPEARIMAGRQGFVLAECTGKVVLHVGCVDSGLLQHRFALGELLHQRLARVARELWGVDVDAAGIRFLRQQGFERVFAIDVSSEVAGSPLLDQPYDVVVLGEVLEHLPNPGSLLMGLRKLMQPDRTRLIASVPNAFALTGLLSLAQGIESVHPDHNFYFSRTTLRRLLARSGLRVLEEYVYVFDAEYLPTERLKATRFYGATGEVEVRAALSSIRRLLGRLRHRRLADIPAEVGQTLLKTFLYRRSPYWADGLLVVCARDDDARVTLRGESNPRT